MTKNQENKIFEKYNSISDVVRCPYGRANVREKVDLYVKAAVNLYGVISREELVDIFNKQNLEKTTVEEIYILLLPLVLKEGWYCFYKEYIVHYMFFDDLEYVEYLLDAQAGKPRYLPEKEEFLKYVVEDYEDTKHWRNVLSFMLKNFRPNKNVLQGYETIKDYITYGSGIDELGSIMDSFNFIFQSEEEMQEFFELIMSAQNNTRIWDNKGYTPAELHKISIKEQKNTVKIQSAKKLKVGRNDPCPCGSGKKHKKCCGNNRRKKSNTLNFKEGKLFYEIWHGLLGFVNEYENVIKEKIEPGNPHQVEDMKMHKVRERLWEKPELIDKYIEDNDFSQEKVDILKLWKTNHQVGTFIVLEYQPEYTIALGTNEKGEDRIYGITGLSVPLWNILGKNLPTQMEAILLPFKGKIVYDSFISTLSLSFGQGANDFFDEIYEKAKKHGVITSLE